MYKIIEIDGKEVPLKTGASWILDFKAFFGYEPLGKLYELTNSNDDEEAITKAILNNVEFVYQLLWTFAYQADEKIEKDLRKYFKQFNDIKIVEIFQNIVELALSTLSGDLKVDKKK